jgi:hypothetical protein
MHDIDRTLAEFETDAHEFEAEEYEFESQDPEAGMAMDEAESGVFDESEEMELAAELLAASDEAELDQLLGNLLKRAGRIVGRFVKTPIGKPLGGFLKGAIAKALPLAGSAAGGYFGGPVGAAIGRNLASSGGRMFGLELEGLSPEDQEFEVARRLVRLSGEAARNAASMPVGADPHSAAKAAVIEAARVHAPGLLRPKVRDHRTATPSSAFSPPSRSGRWERDANDRIVLLGL